MIFKSIGLNIYQRGNNVLQKRQIVSFEKRNGISLKKEGLIYQIEI